MTVSGQTGRGRLYTEEHRAFRASVAAFLERHVWPEHDSFLRERSLPRDLWLAAGRLDLLGLEVPAEYGGAGAEDYRFNAALIEELAAVSAGIASCVSMHFDVVAPYLVQLGHPDWKRERLPAVCSGEVITALAMTEPSAGSDLAALTTSAKRVDGGWVLDGSKTFITNGASADLVVVAARTTPNSGARGITLFAVDASAEGFQRGRKLDKIGQHDADTAELFLDGVFVDDKSVLGQVDRGFIHMMEHLPQERLGAAIANVANASQILQETIAYARERYAFGRPIGQFQHNRFLLAELVTRVEVARAYIDQCVEAHVHGELSAVDAAKAKWWSADMQNLVLDRCVQLHGGYGFMSEYRVARAWADARVTSIWAGSNEIMKEIIGRDLGM